MENNPSVQVQNSGIKLNWSHLYDKYYKVLLAVPFILLISCLIYMGSFMQQNGDFIKKDVTLTGGTILTIDTNQTISITELENALKPKFNDIIIRVLTDFQTGEQQAITIESQSEPEPLKEEVSKFLGYELDEKNSSVEFTGNSLSQSFYKELVTALILAFVFMSITIFILFRSTLPSIYVLLCAFLDILVPLTVVDLIGMRVSTAGIAAFLMLIGYSVDTDILLTTRVLKRKEESLNQRIFSSFKTGATMTFSSLVAVITAYFIISSLVLKQIFFILIIGLLTDLLVTWTMNAGLLKWHCSKKEELR